MKKRLLIAAVAATMSVAVTADISITGDAYVSFASQDSQNIFNLNDDNINNDNQRVRIKVVGSAGDTKVVAVIRNGSKTRVDKNAGEADGDLGLHMDSLYVTTKAGPVSIKAGDYWGTIGLGARSMEAPKKNAISVSTEVAGWKLGLFTASGSDSVDENGVVIDEYGSGSTNINASGKIGPVTVSAVHNPDSFTDLSAQATFSGVSIAAEYWDDGTDTKNDTTLIQVSGKVSNFKWEIAQIENDETSPINLSTLEITRNAHSTGKFAPLGSMLIGTQARGNTATAVGDVSDFTKILGVAVSTQVAGNTIKAIYTKNTLGSNGISGVGGIDLTGTELIISRPLSNGATLTVNVGKASIDALNGLLTDDATNTGLRLDVKF